MLTKFRKRDEALLDLNQLKSELEGGLFTVMEQVYEQRKSDAVNSAYAMEDVDQIVEAYAKKNMILAAASSIVPGPFGVLGSIPELLLNFNNQMSMIYDLGCAHGKEDMLTKDLLLDIPIMAFGGKVDLAGLQDQAADLTGSPQEILMQKAQTLGEAMMQRTLKRSIVHFIPVAGPVLMGAWAKLATTRISKSSVKFLSGAYTAADQASPMDDAVLRKLQIEKIKGLTNLIEANNEINENQIDLIGTIIENADLTDAEKEYYLDEALKTGSEFELDYELLRRYGEGDDLVMEMVVMARRGDAIDDLEARYIYQVGEALELDRRLVEGLLQD